jgi:hypothetical protein
MRGATPSDRRRETHIDEGTTSPVVAADSVRGTRDGCMRNQGRSIDRFGSHVPAEHVISVTGGWELGPGLEQPMDGTGACCTPLVVNVGGPGLSNGNGS